MKTITINGVEYVPVEEMKSNLVVPAETLDGMEFKIVRTYSAGVFAGYVESREGKEAVLRNAIRIWYWKGAASLSQLAMEGVKEPNECKFAVPVDKVILTEVIEILDCTQAAKENIEGVPSWKK